ncbi:TPA: ORF6N domain-containing protein [Morganella morganii]|nr:ORF6N domain-containing protein [Morganella morganii]
MNTQICNSVKSMPPVVYAGAPVITTGIMASLYDTDETNIKMNFSRNAERFVEGKHYFKLEGIDLKEFKNKVTKSYPVESQSCIVGKRARSLTLWTERGAARHAKMLDTDQAWDVFEALEDFYFCKKEEAEKKPNFRQSTAKELIPLRQTAERLIAHGVGNIYPDIWKHVHAEFGVQHINELLPEQIPLAISYLDALEGEFIPKQGEIAVQHDFNFPLSWWNQYKVALKARGIDGFSHKEPCFFPYRLLYGDICESPSAISNLLSALTEAGYDVSAARLEHRAHRHYAERSLQSLRKLNDVVSPFIDGGLRMQISAPIPADWR